MVFVHENLERAAGVAVVMVLMPVAWWLAMKAIYWALFLLGRLVRRHQPQQARIGAHASQEPGSVSESALK